MTEYGLLASFWKKNRCRRRRHPRLRHSFVVAFMQRPTRKYTTDTPFSGTASPNTAKAIESRYSKLGASSRMHRATLCMYYFTRYSFEDGRCMREIIPMRCPWGHVGYMPQVVPLETCRQYPSSSIELCRYLLTHVIDMPQVVYLRHVAGIPAVVPNKYHLRHAV